jgi:hypothetical protein
MLWQTLRAAGRLYAVRIEDRGTLAEPELRVSIFSDRLVTASDRETVRREMAWRFDRKK